MKKNQGDVLARYADKDGKLDPKRAVEAVQSLMRIGLVRMNRIQEPFIRIKNANGRTPRRRILETGEKCLTYSTPVDTVDGPIPIGRLWESGQPFEVFAWDGKKRVVAQAHSPIIKPESKCYRIELSDGRWIEGADRHQVLCDGHWCFLEEIYESLHGLRASSSGLFLSVRASGELHLSQTPSGFALSCSPDCRLCDEQLRRAEGSDQVFVPSPDDAPLHSQTSLHKGAGERAHASNPCTLRDRLSNARNLVRSATRTLRSSIEAACSRFQSFLRGPQLFPQPSTAGAFQLQSSDKSSQCLIQSRSGAFACNPPESGINIVSFHQITSQRVYDFTVDVYHNYYAGGLIHHNTGKTRIGICEDVAHAMGFRPWLDESDPDYKINIQVPNHGLIGCETMAQSVEAKIRPELEALIPAHCAPDWKNDSTGALKQVTLKYDYTGRPCGSTIHIRSYNQPADSFRGIDPHWNHWDEPPPRDILIASERGKVVTNAPSWFTMTPLKEAYIYDMFSVNAFNSGGMDPEIAVFHGSMWDNCQDYCKDCDRDVPENNPIMMADAHAERPVDKCPSCRKVMGFIPRAGILEYLKLFTDPDELAAHIEGKYAHLSGLVYKELDRTEHLYKDFAIPKDWMRIEVVDPHDARPVRWLFGAVSPEDIEINGKQANRIYWYTYLLVSGNVQEIARQVKVKRAEHDYAEPEMVILDAKYGSRTARSLEMTTTWEEELAKAGIDRIRLSHSDPGDIALGHKRVKEYLRPHYSVARNKTFPGMMFAEEGCKGNRSPIMDAFNYQWRPGTDKPEEAYKDFCDCVRYGALEQPTYHPPRDRMDPLREFLAMRQETESIMMHGLRTA